MIRPSTPDDAAAVVPLIDIVFEEMEIPALMALPKRELYPLFEQAFLLPTYRYGYPQTLVHEGAGGIDGILVGYPHSAEAHIDDAFAPLLPKLGLTHELFPDNETYPGEWYVDTLAVAPSARGHGVATQLLTQIEPHAAKTGARCLSLNVDETNPRAERLYRRVGYGDSGTLMIGSHRYKHLTKPLPNPKAGQ
ncbi:GNAT family N-acetyltransferase [Lacticaseibacillus nasuensis]|uniref:GNAT family N-acetyltransferase n=1 Tax=Lacticaseibacillus nasuensis TaxID=944671 RepID=UPI002247A21D|nr:GNAT family N-acetyltransferase [Lacticaseibacillus nasuensis]MCX2454723.1 GNAT family N-acetyltransferase [Lacticaseibacillus nasuensis]